MAVCRWQRIYKRQDTVKFIFAQMWNQNTALPYLSSNIKY